MDLLALEPGILLLAYNDDSEASRSTLVLAMSTDEGNLWHDIAILEADPSGSFHYPTLMHEEEQVWHVVSCDSSSHAMCWAFLASQSDAACRAHLVNQLDRSVRNKVYLSCRILFL